MLRSIYNYAIENNLALPPGFERKAVRYYISLAANGKFLGIVEGSGEQTLCPDIGSIKNGKDKSNIIAEKRSVVLDDKSPLKTEFFKKTMEDASEYEPKLKICLDALNNDEIFDQICSECKMRKVKDTDIISFSVGGESILESENITLWWKEYRKQFRKSGNTGEMVPCLITGELTEPAATLPTVSGVPVEEDNLDRKKKIDSAATASSVSGVPIEYADSDRCKLKPCRLICFDKRAFRSYGLEQSANAPVSEEAFSTVKVGLDELLKSAPILAGMKFVYWYDKPVPKDKDILGNTISNPTLDGEEMDDEDDDEVPESPMEKKRKADYLVNNAKQGQIAPTLASRYTIIILSGVTSRIMVRSYEHGSFEELSKNLRQWNEDISLVKSVGLDNIPPCKFSSRLRKLLSRQKSDKNRLGKELAGLTVTTLNAVLKGSILPDSVAVRALAYIRSEMLDSNENRENKEPIPTPNARACQWLKAWLIRKHRSENKEEHLMAVYNPNHPEAAYHCGALTRVYAEIQLVSNLDPNEKTNKSKRNENGSERNTNEKTYERNRNVNVNIIQKYYASACQTPSLVIGQLSRLSVHHQEKITYWKALDRLRERAEECYASMGDSIPETLSLEQQSLFALGYYQMAADIRKERNENKSEKNEAVVVENTDE